MSLMPRYHPPADWPLRNMVDVLTQFIPKLEAGNVDEHLALNFWRLVQYPMYSHAPLPPRGSSLGNGYYQCTKEAVTLCAQAFDQAFSAAGFEGGREERFERLRLIVSARMGSEEHSAHRFELPLAVQILKEVLQHLEGHVVARKVSIVVS